MKIKKNLTVFGVVLFILTQLTLFICPEPSVLLGISKNTPPATDTSCGGQWSLEAIEAEAAREAGIDGTGVRVALIDSGIYAGHEAFADVHIDEGLNLLTGTADVSDSSGHGTFIAGILAASSDDGIGISGMTDGVTLVPLKCFENGNRTDVNYILSAIYLAVDKYACDVINLSVGLNENVPALRKAVEYAAERGVIIVSAVGNDGSEELYYPAAYDTVVGVGAVGQDYAHSSFSQHNGSVFVVAPGDALCGPSIDSSRAYCTLGGTSYAVPHVTALAAMAKFCSRDIGPEEFKSLLAETSFDLGEPGYDREYGYGLVNTANFVTRLLDLYPAKTCPQLTISDTVQIEATPGEMVSVDMSGWFSASGGGTLQYCIHSSTALGQSSISGSTLTYVADGRDAGKNIRFSIAARDGGLESTRKAVLTVCVRRATMADLSLLSSYTDADSHWAKESLAFSVERGLLRGISPDRLYPAGTMTRAMFATVLMRMSGLETARDTTFTDVFPDDWYYNAICFVQEYGISDGDGAGHFEPGAPISRQEIAAMLYRYACAFDLYFPTQGTGALYGFTDLDQIDAWAWDAISWAVGLGILSGDDPLVLDPLSLADRAEVSVILERFLRTLA